LAETAPEHEALGRGDGRNRVHLEKAEPPHRVENPTRGTVEQLGPHRDPSRLFGGDDSRRTGHGGIIP
jgi:hypothetical protein